MEVDNRKHFFCRHSRISYVAHLSHSLPQGAINNGLIKEALYVKVKGRKFKVDVIEEVGDIMELHIEVASNNNSESNKDDSEEETDSEDDESDEDDDDDAGDGGRPEDDGVQKRDEDEESRCSDMPRVCETPEEEVIKEQKLAAPREDVYGNRGTKDVNKLEKQDKDDSYF
ncbi:hypothetical protein Tco_0931154 [Tanacetum coccineum]